MPSRTATPPAPSIIKEKLKGAADSVSTTEPPRPLPARFTDLKKECIKEENIPAVVASYERLKIALEAENDRLAEQGQAAVPEVAWSEVVANGIYFPDFPGL
jgi:hypothetical protein